MASLVMTGILASPAATKSFYTAGKKIATLPV
jgi:hypothetical protein